MRSKSSSRSSEVGRRTSSAFAAILVIAVGSAWIAPVGALVGPNLSATALGFCGGDDWEPEIATGPDGRHVYVVWTHFPGDPSCDPASANPTRVYIRASADAGRTFGPSHVVADRIGGVDYPRQVDSVVTVDQLTGAVYVSFLAYGLGGSATDVAVAKSTDFGAHFSAAKVNGLLCRNCDHPWTIAYGPNVYTAYAQHGEHFVTRSPDGGSSWIETNVLKADRVAFAEGAVMDEQRNVYFAWGDCKTGSCKGKAAGEYRVSRTAAGTSNTTFSHVATAPGGPACPYSPSCGFAFFGIQNDIAIDAAGTLYVVWQDGHDHALAGGPPIVQLSRSTDRGEHWTYVGRVDDKTATGCAGAKCYALFPRVEAGAAGQIGVMWMDDRLGSPLNHRNGWNVWLRTSTDGGTTWAAPSRRISTFDAGRPESEPNGFRFPYGDYEGIDFVTSPTSTLAVMAWGEGINYTGGPSDPGSVVYRRVEL